MGCRCKERRAALSIGIKQAAQGNLRPLANAASFSVRTGAQDARSALSRLIRRP